MTFFQIRSRWPAIAIGLLILRGTAFAWTGDPWDTITRATIQSNAALMIDSTWTPKNTFTDWQQDSTYYTYNEGVAYTGVAYTQNDPQQTWPEFQNSVTNPGGGGVFYGNDCSGFVSICWRLPARENTTKFETGLGTYWVSLGPVGSAASVQLLPGDALNYPGVHMVMFLSYESGGILTMEQTPNNAQRLFRSFSSLANYRPIRRLNILENSVISLGGNLAFGSVLVGSNSQATLTIHNSGISNLTVGSISCPTGFTGNWSGTIIAGGTQNVPITFSPATGKAYGGNLTVNSDATIGTNIISVSGNGTTATAMARLLLLAPGETAAYGVAPGKTGSPVAQFSTVGYSVTVALLDTNYNVLSNVTDTIALTSSVADDGLPPNAALAGGTQTFMITNNTVGTAALTATDMTQGASVAAGISTVTVGINSTMTSLASSQNPASEGQILALTATVSGAGVKTGTVTFMNGNAAIGTATVSNGSAMFATSAGAGSYSITAIYNGDSNNSVSTSGAWSQTIESAGATPVPPARLLQEGFDYAVQTIPTAGLGPWAISQSSIVLGIITNDLAGDTTPALRGFTNSINPAAHLVIGASAITDRDFYRSFSNSVSSGSLYFSFLFKNGFGVTNADEVICLLTATNGPPHTNGSLGTITQPDGAVAYPDPLSLHARSNGVAGGYQLGIERLGGNTVWATNNLKSGAAGVSYLVVLKYVFGTTGSCSLYIDPPPGNLEPLPAAVTATGGTESNNVGRVVFYEGFNPPTSGIGQATNVLDGYNYDVLRADTNWFEVTPPATPAPAATKLAFSPAAQTINASANSAPITVTLQDQSNHVFTAASDMTVSLISDSDSGMFVAADGVTIITTATIASGTSTATFYYNDGQAGTPAITAATGWLTPATQTETITAIPIPVQPSRIVSVTGTGTGPYQASVIFYGQPNAGYHVQRSVDLHTWTTPGTVVLANSNGVINYTDSAGPVAAYYRLIYP